MADSQDNKPKASHNNTKAPMTGTLPTGKDHSKIVVSAPPME